MRSKKVNNFESSTATIQKCYSKILTRFPETIVTLYGIISFGAFVPHNIESKST